jgi:hypothetical protein
MLPKRFFGVVVPLRSAALAAATLAAIDGCGVGGLTPQPTQVAVRFSGWNVDSLAAGACFGYLQNEGKAASHVRVHVLYATPQGDTVLAAIPQPSNISDFGSATFTTPAQETATDRRFPRVDSISWDGGGFDVPWEPPSPHMYGWCWTGPDSVRGQVLVSGEWAYRVTVTLQTRDGVKEILTVPHRIGPGYGAFFYSVAGESAGVMVLPRVTKFRWENYAGTPDSVISPLIDYRDVSSVCY